MANQVTTRLDQIFVRVGHNFRMGEFDQATIARDQLISR